MRRKGCMGAKQVHQGGRKITLWLPGSVEGLDMEAGRHREATEQNKGHCHEGQRGRDWPGPPEHRRPGPKSGHMEGEIGLTSTCQPHQLGSKMH